ncbi:hypothetical protein LSTR_LSTR009372 [Laodelphax striatellus]|uniref:Gustatory receptor n=1 Tax=Laodelphax striatellus TaxID=195883 RepID=A0A482WL22_LAOST|nr:hypothetical protein LSTR_LSTR009372 [Laodelphax striatellus]
MTKSKIWKSISNFFHTECSTIFDSLAPLVRFSIFFGITPIRIAKNRKTFTYRLLDIPRFLTSIWIIYYLRNSLLICFTRNSSSTVYLRCLCIVGNTIEILHLIIPIWSGVYFVKEIKLIHEFDNHIKQMPNVRKFKHTGSGLTGAFIQFLVCSSIYPFIVYDYVRMGRQALFIISLFFIGMHALDNGAWFAVTIYELFRRFKWLKIEIADTVRRLECAGCDEETAEEYIYNPTKRFIACDLSKDEILLECLRLSYSNLLLISEKLVTTLGCGMLLTIFQYLAQIAFYDFYVYMYLMREINGGLILGIGHKLFNVLIAVWFSEKLMMESRAVLEDLQSTKLTHLSKFSRLQVEIIQAQINAKPLRVHVCNFFVLNKRFFASVILKHHNYYFNKHLQHEMTKSKIWKSITNVFHTECSTIFDSLAPLVRLSILFGITSIRIEKNCKSFTYQLFDIPRFLTSMWILYYLHNSLQSCFARIESSTLYLMCLCILGTGIEALHLIIPIWSGVSYVKEIKLIHKFDNHIKQLPYVRKFKHSGSGLAGAFVQFLVCSSVYPFIAYDYIRMGRQAVFIISLFFIGMHSLDNGVWFAVTIYELFRRFRWLKIEIADTVKRLESAGCDKETAERYNYNPSKRFIASELSKDEILLECLRLSYSKLLSVSDKLVTTLGCGMLLNIFQNLVLIAFYDFYVYMYLMREINGGLILGIGHKLFNVLIAVWFSEKLMMESKAVLEDLGATKLTRLSKFSRLQVQIIQAQIKAKPLTVHVCNLFVLNKRFFTKMLSTILTYLIVMMQILSSISKYGGEYTLPP